MQHLELARDIAERMNTKYGGNKWKKLGGRGGRIFKVPDAFIAPVGARVMSLTVSCIHWLRACSLPYMLYCAVVQSYISSFLAETVCVMCVSFPLLVTWLAHSFHALSCCNLNVKCVNQKVR